MDSTSAPPHKPRRGVKEKLDKTRKQSSLVIHRSVMIKTWYDEPAHNGKAIKIALLLPNSFCIGPSPS